MNTRFFPLALLAMALTALLAGAAGASSIDPTGQVAETVATPATKLAAETLLAEPYAEYQYEMSNGRRLRVTTVGRSLLVQYGRRHLAQMEHDGHGRFVSRDGRFVMRFGLDDEGRPYAASLNLPAALS